MVLHTRSQAPFVSGLNRYGRIRHWEWLVDLPIVNIYKVFIHQLWFAILIAYLAFVINFEKLPFQQCNQNGGKVTWCGADVSYFRGKKLSQAENFVRQKDREILRKKLSRTGISEQISRIKLSRKSEKLYFQGKKLSRITNTCYFFID